MGFSGNAKMLFRWLLPDRGKNFLTLDDVDRQAAEALARGDYDMITVRGSIFGTQDSEEEKNEWRKKSFLERQTSSKTLEWQAKLRAEQQKELAESMGHGSIHLPKKEKRGHRGSLPAHHRGSNASMVSEPIREETA